MDVLVAGGTGFIGRTLCRELADRGHGVTALARSPEGAEVPGSVETVATDITDDDLTEVVTAHDVVVNLVALPAHRQPTTQSHQAVQVEGVTRLVRASEQADTERFVQLSALGVETDIETEYFVAKRQAERIVTESELDHVIYRPSVVFGDSCGFFDFLDTWLPPVVAPFPGGGEMPVQPVWVGDLTQMVADGIEASDHVGQTYQIGGPETLTVRAIIERVYPDRTVVSVPMDLAEIGLTLVDPLDSFPFGADQFRFLGHDNTVENNDISAFGLAESDLKTLQAHVSD